jgi:hypothetical protein
MRWEGHVARMGDMRNSYEISVAKPEGKSSLEGPRRRWEDNITMDLRKIRWEVVDLMNSVQDRELWQALVITLMNFGVP